jgi:phenylalanyl-tRNA synthetase beta chain
MLEILSGNASFNNQNVKLWELATVYLPKESANELPEEKKCMTLGMYGSCDFFTLKAVCDKVLIDAGIAETEYTACEDNPSYHPGRCALVTGKNGETLAVLGQIHPTVADNYGFSAPVFCAEIDLEAVFNSASKKIEYKPLPKFPASTRDFSFVCEDALEVGKIAKIMKRAGGKLTENVELFDIYRGPQVGEGKKSVSMRVTLRASDRTLTVEEVEKVSAKILRSLENDLGITLRG